MPIPELQPPNVLSDHPFRRAVLRGLTIFLPPLLTIAIFLWVWNTVAVYLLDPLELRVQSALVSATQDIRDNVQNVPPDSKTATIDGRVYRRVSDNQFIPDEVYNFVQMQLHGEAMPSSAIGIYRSYVQLKYLQRHIVIPIFLCVFVLALYLLGKFMAAGMGGFFWARLEFFIARLPLVRSVYSSVKQVTDFMFNKRDLEFTRVVAVEYPREGIWTLGFVTSEGMLDVRAAANEPVVAMLLPTSPWSVTGYTVMVRKSEVLDLNLTVNQAFQYVVSCGVVVPPHQLAGMLKVEKPAVAAATTSDAGRP